MSKIEDILTDDRFKKQIQRLNTQTLKLVLSDHIKALIYAKKGVEEVEPEKSNDMDYLQAVADGMQKLAKMILEKRSKKL